jgi:hypothetical protein
MNASDVPINDSVIQEKAASFDKFFIPIYLNLAN